MSYFSVIFFLPLLFWLINFLIISINYHLTLTHSSSFESGFEYFHFMSYKSSLHFFKLSLIFISFEMELIYILILFNSNYWILTLLILLALLLTLVVEYISYSIQWSV